MFHAHPSGGTNTTIILGVHILKQRVIRSNATTHPVLDLLVGACIQQGLHNTKMALLAGHQEARPPLLRTGNRQQPYDHHTRYAAIAILCIPSSRAPRLWPLYRRPQPTRHAPPRGDPPCWTTLGPSCLPALRVGASSITFIRSHKDARNEPHELPSAYAPSVLPTKHTHSPSFLPPFLCPQPTRSAPPRGCHSGWPP